uniref:Tetratricopeptide repeat protein n=1 Tax=candidate division WOR-3 bacterium TaxID=2052148 RepID=A0A7C2K3C3_UNCW3
MANINYELAKELHQHGKLEEAKTYFQKALEEEPHSPVILSRLRYSTHRP